MSEQSTRKITIQRRNSKTIQTHNAVSVGASGSSTSTWFDSDGFTEVAFTLLNDASTNSSLGVFWSNDGTNIHGYEIALGASTSQWKAGSVPIKSRYFKTQISNSDTASHTMSSWAYLKA
jgi:hypothetical protein